MSAEDRNSNSIPPSGISALGGCGTCHAGSLFSNSDISDGLRVPGLRNVALTAPYMHDGSVATLSDVVRHLTPYVGTITNWFVGAAGSVGGLFVHLLLTIAISAVLYASGEAAADWSSRFGRRLAGSRGEAAVVLAGQAIRSVALSPPSRRHLSPASAWRSPACRGPDC